MEETDDLSEVGLTPIVLVSDKPDFAESAQEIAQKFPGVKLSTIDLNALAAIAYGWVILEIAGQSFDPCAKESIEKLRNSGVALRTILWRGEKDPSVHLNLPGHCNTVYGKTGLARVFPQHTRLLNTENKNKIAA